MPYQQPVINVNAVRVGSVKVEVSDDGNTFSSLGTGNAAKFAEKLTTQDLVSDNGGLIKTVVMDQTCEVSFNMMELDLDILNQVRGGIDDYSVITGESVDVTAEAKGTGWTQGKPIKLNHKNGANTIVTSIVVKAATDTLEANTDYRTYVGDGANGELGYTYIVPITAQTAAITVDYTYVPNAAKVIKTGGKTTIQSKYVRLTNVNAAGKEFRITVYKAQNADGLSIDFPGDDEGKAWEVPVKFSGRKDATRAAGDQLFTIYDEQSQ